MYYDLEDVIQIPRVIHYESLQAENRPGFSRTGQHSEEIIFEIENTVSELNLSNWDFESKPK